VAPDQSGGAVEGVDLVVGQVVDQELIADFPHDELRFAGSWKRLGASLELGRSTALGVPSGLNHAARLRPFLRKRDSAC
jgi:hypothetical protein